MMNNDIFFGTHYNYKFSDVFESAADFVGFSEECEIPTKITPENLNLLYYLLYARYGNSTIASWDTNQFKYKMFSIIFMYGPTWETRLKVQDEIRNLTPEELTDGSTQITNHAYNPSTAPATNSFTPLQHTNDQTAGKWKKSKLEGYALLLEVLRADVSKEFLDRFENLFIRVVEPTKPLFYTTTPEEQETLQI